MSKFIDLSMGSRKAGQALDLSKSQFKVLQEGETLIIRVGGVFDEDAVRVYLNQWQAVNLAALLSAGKEGTVTVEEKQ